MAAATEKEHKAEKPRKVEDGPELVRILRESGSGEGKLEIARACLTDFHLRGERASAQDVYDALAADARVFPGVLEKVRRIMETGTWKPPEGAGPTGPQVEDVLLSESTRDRPPPFDPRQAALDQGLDEADPRRSEFPGPREEFEKWQREERERLGHVAHQSYAGRRELERSVEGRAALGAIAGADAARAQAAAEVTDAATTRPADADDVQFLENLTVAQLKDVAEKKEIDLRGATSKEEILARVKDAHAGDMLEALTVPELKKMARDRDLELKGAGTKAEIIEALRRGPTTAGAQTGGTPAPGTPPPGTLPASAGLPQGPGNPSPPVQAPAQQGQAPKSPGRAQPPGGGGKHQG